MQPTIQIDNSIEPLVSFYGHEDHILLETVSTIYKISCNVVDMLPQVLNRLMGEYHIVRQKKTVYPINVGVLLGGSQFSGYSFVIERVNKHSENLKVSYNDNLYTIVRYEIQQVEGYNYVYLYLDNYIYNYMVLSFTPDVTEKLDIIIEQLDYCVSTGTMLYFKTKDSNQTLTFDLKGVLCQYTVVTALY